MRKRISIAVVTALGSLALLIPAGSAQAATPRSIPFCGQLTSSGYQPMTLRPGEICGFWPVAVSQMMVTWDIVKNGDPNLGGVCIGVLQFPPGWPNGQPLSPTGSGTAGSNWYCNPWRWGFSSLWVAHNPFGAVYGQPVVVNFSKATIRTLPQASDGVKDTLWYFS
jgi:hypothetical protein